MSHKILKFDRKQTGKFEVPDPNPELDLEHYSGPVQVMSPEESAYDLPLSLRVCGNVPDRHPAAGRTAAHARIARRPGSPALRNRHPPADRFPLRPCLAGIFSLKTNQAVGAMTTSRSVRIGKIYQIAVGAMTTSRSAWVCTSFDRDVVIAPTEFIYHPRHVSHLSSRPGSIHARPSAVAILQDRWPLSHSSD